ncbi:MAG: hypothetical protein IPM51_01915 [Sphingobacteriaceae bacterium]|nr:hypothetical protein [Sphingobacteriaceae bacterium]
MDNTKKESLKVIVEVKGKNYSKGQVINSFEADAIITKESEGRLNQNDEDTITVIASDCGTPKLEAKYQSKSIGEGAIKTNIEIELKGKTLDLTKNQLIDAIAAGAKLTKADAGRTLDKAVEDLLTLKAEKNCESNCASANAHYSTKISEIAE